MSVEQLEKYVGATDVQDTAFVQTCWDEAEALVTQLINDSELEASIPPAILTRAKLEAGSELFHRRQAPNGVMQFADLGMGGTTTRVARDPLVGVYPILARWLPGGFA